MQALIDLARLRYGRAMRGRDRRRWYQRDAGVWLVGGALTATILAFTGHVALRGSRPRITTSVVTATPLADGSLLVLERTDRAVSDGDGGAEVTTTFVRRRVDLASGRERARTALARPQTCVAATEALAWCWATDARVELVDGELRRRASLAELDGGRHAHGLPGDALRVDARGGLLLLTTDGGWERIDPATLAVTASDGAEDPGRQPTRPAAVAWIGDRQLELVARPGGGRALRVTGVAVAVEAGPGAAAEPTYLTDGVLATAAGAALTLDDDVVMVERASTAPDAERRLTRLGLGGERRWSTALPGAVSEVGRADGGLVLVAGGALRLVDVTTGALRALPRP